MVYISAFKSLNERLAGSGHSGRRQKCFAQKSGREHFTEKRKNNRKIKIFYASTV
jgi:hypothetical protein